MALTPDNITRLAKLARLELTPKEQAAMLVELNGFFDLATHMASVDTGGIEPLFTPLSAVREETLRLRDDAVTQTDQRTLNQRSAPKVENGLYLVPRVLES
jgi:aspartyl-tRNA(Asn)/glutamyl-tRNA(Gln) amidotransferase subunit C